VCLHQRSSTLDGTIVCIGTFGKCAHVYLVQKQDKSLECFGIQLCVIIPSHLPCHGSMLTCTTGNGLEGVRLLVESSCGSAYSVGRAFQSQNNRSEITIVHPNSFEDSARYFISKKSELQ
jgi:hypothetical protein